MGEHYYNNIEDFDIITENKKVPLSKDKFGGVKDLAYTAMLNLVEDMKLGDKLIKENKPWGDILYSEKWLKHKIGFRNALLKRKKEGELTLKEVSLATSTFGYNTKFLGSLTTRYNKRDITGLIERILEKIPKKYHKK